MQTNDSQHSCSDHTHDHGSHDHGHRHDLRLLGRRRLRIALAINAVFLVVEIAGGLLTHSLALLADAGHMFTDVAALVLALFVAWLAESVPTPKRTYGLLRAEVLGAFINGAALVVIVGLIFIEAWRRFGNVPEINAPGMLVVAVLGLAANLGSAWVLYGSRNDTINMRGAFLHMLADTLGSVGAIIAGAVILLTGWTLIDSIASLVIGFLILWSSWGLLTQTLNILLEATPENIDYNAVRGALLDIGHIQEVHDLHIWTIASGIPSLSAHLKLVPECSDTNHWQNCLRETQAMLRERFGIVHSTLQFEPEDFERDGRVI
ncbi:cation diffusion facilitator family transporter [bacterium]|nr:cation diffusion facilitator family transporter [bacterium]